MCDRCRESAAFWARANRAKKRAQQLRNEKLQAHIAADAYADKMRRKRRRFLEGTSAIYGLAEDIATFEWDEEELPYVREDLMLARDLIAWACGLFDRRDDVDKLRLRIEKLRELEASPHEGEAALAHERREQAESKLRLIQGGEWAE